MGMSTRAAVYVRISADPAGERAGVERQRADCLALAERNGWTLVGDAAKGDDVYEDNDVSAYSGKPRPAFERLMRDAEAGLFDQVIAWSSDRLYRRVSDLTRITEELATRARIVTVMGGDVDLTTAEGILRAQVLGSVAEFESRRKGERVAAQARQRAEAGRQHAALRPLGWAWLDPCPGAPACKHRTPCDPAAGMRPRAGSRQGLYPHPVEGPALAEAYRQIVTGSSLRSVTAWLASEVPTGTQGAPLDPTAVRGALLAPRNAGLVAHRGRIVAEAADGARIVDRDLWERVGVILNDPKRRTSPGRPTATPLSKVLRCGKCDGPMCASAKHGTSGKVPVYMCSRGYHLTRRRSLLDGPILDLVGEVLVVLGARGVLTAAGGTDTSGPIRDQIAAYEGRRDVLAGMVASGAMHPDDYKAAADKIRAELETLTAALTRATGRPALASLGPDKAAGWAILREQAEAGDVDDLRAVLAELVDHIVVMPAAVSGRPTRTDVRIVWADWVPGTPPTHPTAEVGVVAVTRDTRRAEAVRLRAEGLGVSAIADRLGVDRSTIRADLAAMEAER